jgi:hypothetical protein
MDAAAADKTSLMKEKKDGPSRAMLRYWEKEACEC